MYEKKVLVKCLIYLVNHVDAFHMVGDCLLADK